MDDKVKNLVDAAELALASKKPCPSMARDSLHCMCWHCILYRALKEFKHDK